MRDHLVAADHAGQPEPHTAAHLVPPLLPPPTPGGALRPLRPHEVVGEGTGILIAGRVPHPLDLSPVVQDEGGAGEAAALRRGVGAGPVLGLHTAATRDQVLASLGVDTVALDGGPGRPLAVHPDGAVRPPGQQDGEEPGRCHVVTRGATPTSWQ